MSATVTPLSSHPRFKRAREADMGKAQLALALGYSKRWVELRMRDGLPYTRRPNGTTRFVLSEVEPWVVQWLKERRG